MINQFLSNFKGKSILITGASGLICSKLIDNMMEANKLYNLSIKIYAVSRNVVYAKQRFKEYWNDSYFTYIQHDIITPLIINSPIDYIVHGASNASPKAYSQDPVGTMKSNLWGVDNLLALARDKKARLLYISSGEIYGEGNGNDFTEDYSGFVDPISPRSCYPSSKRASETLCISYADQYNVDVVIARPCHIYGKDIERDNRAFAQFLRCVIEGKNIVLKSDGTQLRSYCHVQDCCSALLYILCKGEKAKAYNIANKNSVISIRELAEMIARIGNKTVLFERASLEEAKGYSVIQRAVLNSTRLEDLGWKPVYSIENGIKEILQTKL